MVERASPFAEAVAAERAGITLSAVPRGSVWQVACWPDSFDAVQSDLATACGCTMPAPGQIATAADGGSVIRVEPLKWWIIGPEGAECPVQPGPEQGAWLDLSHDQAAIAIKGTNAAELVKRMVSIDLREAAFPNHSYASTEMHHMITRVLRQDADGPSYQIWVMRSYADTLREIAAEHLHHFDLRFGLD